MSIYNSNPSERFVQRSDGKGKKNSRSSTGVSVSVGGVAIEFPIIFTGYSFVQREKNQVNETFNEQSHINAFGKAADALQLTGYFVFAEKGRTVNKSFVKKYINEMRAFRSAERGKLATALLYGGIVFTGVIDGIQVDTRGETDNTQGISMTLIGVDEAFTSGTASAAGSGATSTGSGKVSP